ncbi:hypothetical protein [Tateyamaria pelophila]|uniref:hypothetical protein n=1 Tax=Tateyamaria pelophila TaxID=328415 RepID=UPI001CBFCE88|nr:hypothetical protein [Tateyamaria pelophila]
MENRSDNNTPSRTEIDDLKTEINLLKQNLPRRGRSLVARVLSTVGVILVASALGFGALTAAGVDALRIDEQGNVHILGAVTIEGVATVNSLTTQGEVSAGTITGNTVTSEGLLTARAGLTAIGDTTMNGMTVSSDGNVRIPGNLTVDGLNDRLFYTATEVGVSTDISAADLARLCGDGDGCEVRLAMFDYDTVESGPASVVTWLYCDADCKHWRTTTQLLSEGSSVGPQVGGTDNDNVIKHVINKWSCYFTDGKYESTTVNGDTAVGFGLLLWTQFPGSRCTIAIID